MLDIYICFFHWSEGAIGQKGVFIGKRFVCACEKDVWQKRKAIAI